MKTNLRGRVALITGSSRGLGKTIAETLAAEGTDIILTHVQKLNSSLKKVVDKIYSDHGVRVYASQVDATDQQAIFKFFEEIIPRFGRLDILVNNVGNIEKFGKFEDLTDEDWQRSFDLSFMSVVRFIRYSLPYLKKSDQARIINISSLSAHQPSFTGLNPHYGMAKNGILNLTKNLANDFGRYSITVNSVCPSTLAGGGWNKNVEDRSCREKISIIEAEDMMRKEESRKSPLGKIGELKDVADLVIFLASSNANFLTGHCYNIDGGITRSV